MPQRNTVIEIQEPSSLRRSPRLLQLKDSPQTPNLTSKITSSTSSSKNISSRKPQNGAKSLISMKECEDRSMNYSKSANGSRYYAKSANGSRRKSNLGSGIEGIKRSMSLCNEVTSLVDGHISCDNDSIDVSVFCNTRSRRKSKLVSLVEIDSLAMKDYVDSPVTPIGVGEKKCGGLMRQCNDSGTSGSIVLSLGDSLRRVTRSCSKKMVGNEEDWKIENMKLKDIDLFDDCVGGIELRRCVRSVRGLIGNYSRKGKEDGVHRSLVCGLEKVRCVTLSPCATPGVGRGGRYSRTNMGGTKGKTDDSCEQLVGSFERRITRSVSKRIAKESDLCGQDRERGNTGISFSTVPGKGRTRKAKENKQECNGTRKFRRTEWGKKVKQGSIISFSATLEVEEAAVRDIGVKEKESHGCGKQDGDKLINASSDITKGNKLIGVKRKRKQESLHGRDHSWTNEQEAALQRAYFAAKPSPHFWKKVSKLVPGKSAQECFDKVHSDNLTPLSPRHTSRLKKRNSPSEFLLTGDELLKTIPTKSKKHFKTKLKSHVARRNVRHLLRKYCQDSEADLFSILEPSGNPLAETIKLKAVQLTPTQASGSPGSSSKCQTMSSSGHKKRLSRFSGANKSPLTSPPVLKRVKNMALHEKYIDQLHVREGKRKVVSSRYSKSVKCHKDEAQNSAQRKDVIKAAKDALVSEARDVIEKFRQSQTNLMEAYSDSEDVLSDNDEDDMFL